MILLGITGPIGHGKTTMAGFLAQQEPTSCQIESSEIVTEVADRLNKYFLWDNPSELDLTSVNNWLAHLPKILLSVTNCTISLDAVRLQEHAVAKHPEEYAKLFEYIQGARQKSDITQQRISVKNKGVYRPLLQWLGGYLVEHAHEGIWYDEIIRRATIAAEQGCRLCIIGGVRFPSDADIIHAAGGRVIQIQRPSKTESDASDPTERKRSKIRSDASVVNNGSLDELMQISKHVYANLAEHSLKETYVAKA